MRTDVLRLLEAVQKLDDVRSPSLLTARVADATAVFGVTSVSVNLIATPLKILRPGMIAGYAWRDWSNRYGRERFAMADPAIRVLRSQSRPFTWSEALARHPSAEAERVYDACRETTGAREGFVVPVRDSDEALFSAAFCGPDLDLDPAVRAMLHLVGHTYAIRARELLHGVDLEPRNLLSARQIQVLRLILEGKGDAEMGLILHISESTAHKHVEAAKRIMHATKRAQAAFDAWRRGWLD